MQPDKSGFKAFQAKKLTDAKVERLATSKFNVTVLKQAAVKSKWLVDSPSWDTFLSYIQADIEDLDAMIASARHVMENPAIVNHDEIMKAKIVLLEAEAMKRALNIAITYPSQIIKDKKELDDRQKDLNLEEK